jgi:hypothetical protein
MYFRGNLIGFYAKAPKSDYVTLKKSIWTPILSPIKGRQFMVTSQRCSDLITRLVFCGSSGSPRTDGPRVLI